MELKQLEYFLTICEEMHFTKASERLGISQPTLSHQIKALENELGVPLFDRIGKKIRITEAGLILQEQCHEIFSNLKNAREQIGELQTVKRGKLVIGAMPGELNQLALRVLLKFHEKYPNIQVKILDLYDIADRVIQNEVDFAITILTSEDDEKLEKIHLYHEDFYLAVSESHILAKREKINFKEAVKYPLVLFPTNHKCRQLIDSACIASNISIVPIIESTDLNSIINLVKEGAGGTILPKTLLNFANDGSLKLIKIENPTLRREIGITFLKDKFLGCAARGFLELLTTHVIKTKLTKN